MSRLAFGYVLVLGSTSLLTVFACLVQRALRARHGLGTARFWFHVFER
jgi:hypothetical protein